MLRLIYGCPGSEKSEYLRRLAAEDLQDGKKVLLIVPERFSVAAETAMTLLCGDANKLNLEILSFKRLCNRVFREYGGLCYNYAAGGGRLLMMWRALCAVKDDLRAYGGLRLRDVGTIETMLDSVISFKRAGITPDVFAQVCGKCEGESLRNKLYDLSKIYSSYENLLHDRYDDPEEDLTRLCEKLGEHPEFFAERQVYIDSTAAFTKQELAVVCRALDQSPCVTAAFELLPEKYAGGKTETRAMLEKLRWCVGLLTNAERERGREAQILAVFDRPVKKSQDLAALEKRLFDDAEEPYEGEASSLVLSSFADIYEECKCTAARILRDVQKGGRFEDHCVVARDLSQYAGILDRVFESNGVPYTMTEKVLLASRAAVRLITSALRLLCSSFRIEDLMTYLKTGYTDVDEIDGDAAFLLEEYALLWHIEGEKRWFSDCDFAMNPDGHTGVWTDEGREKLQKINAARQALCAPLRQMSEDFADCKTVEDRAEVLFRYIENMRLYEKIEREKALCASSGGKDAQERMYLEQTYAQICDALDELVYAAGDLPAPLEDFALMLDLVLSHRKLGSIPPGRDRVLVSDPFNLKPGSVKTLHALGLNEGIFPAPVRAGGMFSPKERKLLSEEYEVELPGNDERAPLDEEYLCYTVLTLPDKKLYASCHKKNLQGATREPSELFEALVRFTQGKQTGETGGEDFVYGSANQLDIAFCGERSARSLALRRIFEEKQRHYADNAKRAPLISLDDVIPSDKLREIYKGDAPVTSLSRLEKFLRCPFSYTCTYILKLRDPPVEEVSDNEIGTVIHDVFKRVIGQSIDKKERFGELPDAEIERRTNEALKELEKSMTGGERDERVGLLFGRIGEPVRTLALNLRDEFSQSSFEPVFCEVEFGNRGSGKGMRLPGIVAGGEYRFTIKGTVDRVDAWRDGGKTYLRVIDYKTGKKDFARDKLSEGENMQMPLYMRALLENGDGEFLRRVGASSIDELQPAAVLYHSARLPNAEYPGIMTDETMKKALQKSILRTGMLLDDEKVLRAMNESLDGSFIPGAKKNSKARVTKEDFDESLAELDDTLSRIGKKMREGAACTDAGNCGYCKMRPICRRVSKVDGENRNEE